VSAEPTHERTVIDYILPIKSASRSADAELTEYLRWLSFTVNVIVVDGSDSGIFHQRNQAWRSFLTHVRPAPDLGFANGKVNGVLTGVRLSTADKLIVADDDVRHDARSIARTALLLDRYDLVVPQNYFTPTPWHARWDTARTLLNRLTPSGDFPGTIALRRARWLVESGYDGDTLFENLELIRTARAHGAQILIARDLYVRRLPPSSRHFGRQRLRQAYDSQAQPGRLLVELTILPVLLLWRRSPARLGGAALASLALAEAGRRRAAGSAVFPPTASLFAPLWVLERGICSWLALATRVRWRGIKYSEGRISCAAHSVRQLRRSASPLSAADLRSP
jgi:hypothetical protein